MDPLQYAQYEILKTEMKEEYDKRLTGLNRKIEER